MMLTGMNAITGKWSSGDEHLLQSIRRIIETPIGTRVRRRDFGSNIYQLIDEPYSRELVADMTSEIAEALEKWEPRVEFTGSKIIQADASGKIHVEVFCEKINDGKELTVELLL